MFPADRLPVAVYVYYDNRGKRSRKFFPDGKSWRPYRFYAKKLKEGRNPRVRLASGSSLFDEESKYVGNDEEARAILKRFQEGTE